jgi:hypothetical protein
VIWVPNHQKITSLAFVRLYLCNALKIFHGLAVIYSALSRFSGVEYFLFNTVRLKSGHCERSEAIFTKHLYLTGQQ